MSQADDPEPPAPGANEILASILDEVGELSNLIELFYLSREPGALDVLRWIAALPDEPRTELVAFIAAAGTGKQAVRVKRTGDRVLRLTIG